LQVVEPVAPEATAEKLFSFSVTADSVVATATLVFDDSHSYVTLYWGDDEVEIINISKWRNTIVAGGGSQDPNTLKFQHVYKSPLDFGRKIVTAVTTDSARNKSNNTILIEVDRRYKLSFYQIVLEFPDHLDSVFETDSEIEARMSVWQDGIIFNSKTWRDDDNTAPNITSGKTVQWSLNQSHFSREISYSDEPIYFDLLDLLVSDHNPLRTCMVANLRVEK